MVDQTRHTQLNGAIVRKRGAQILGPIDLELVDGETTIILGPNGSGKTTLLRVLQGLEKLREGSIERTSNAQSMVFQNPVLLRRSVWENLIYPLKLQSVSKDEQQALANDWLMRIDLADAKNRNASMLSGGEKQKLALARALITKPDLLLLDEPTSNLDGRSTREIEKLIETANAEEVTVLMATHDMAQAKRLAQRVVFLHKGELLEHSLASEFFASPKTTPAADFLKGDLLE
jgi:tungstate transport system ATP-binding protein